MMHPLHGGKSLVLNAAAIHTHTRVGAVNLVQPKQTQQHSVVTLTPTT